MGFRVSKEAVGLMNEDGTKFRAEGRDFGSLENGFLQTRGGRV